MRKEIVNYFFRPRFVFNRFQINLFLISSVFCGIIIGTYFSLNRFFVSRVRATSVSPITYDTSTNFGLGATSSTQIVGSGTSAYLSLTGESGWWSSNYSYRRQLTLGLNGNTSIPSGYAVYVSLTGITASDIYNNSLSNGNDFRVVYWNGSSHTELDRVIIGYGSTAVNFYFKTQAEITSDNTSYFIYYNYPSATSPPAAEGNVFSNTNIGPSAASSASNSYASNPISQINDGVGDSTVPGWGNNNDPGSRLMLKLSSSRKIWKISQYWGGNNTGGWASPAGTYFPAAYRVQYTTDNSAVASDAADSAKWTNLSVSTDGLTVSRTNTILYGSPVYPGDPSAVGTTVTTNINNCTNCWGTSLINTFNPTTALSLRLVFTNGSWVGTLAELYLYPINIAVLSAEPTVSTGAQLTNLSSTGSWESAGSGANVIDLQWNGGWGNGVDTGSTAFVATVANIDTGNTLSFQMKTAPSAVGLSSVSYVNLGSVSSGTVFSLSKSQMDALGIGTSNNRYAQVKVNFSQTNSSNPQLDKFQIIFKEDTTSPSAVSNVAIGMTSGNWTNTPPTATWTAATDSESTVYGYCLSLDQADIGASAPNNDPASSAGVLTGGSSYGGCPYVVATPTINLSALSLTSNKHYYLSIKAVDIAGNISTSGYQNLVSFRYDSTSPTNPLALSAPQTYQSDIDGITIYWSTSGANAATDSGGSEVKGYQYRIGSTGVWYGSSHSGTQDVTDLITAGSYTLDSTYDALSEGENTFYLRTFDNAGNYASSNVTVLIKYSGNAPSEPQNLSVTPSTSTTNSFAFSWAAPATYSGQSSGLEYCYTVNSVPSATTCTWTSASSLSADAFATQPGTNTMYVAAKDETGTINYSAYASVNFEANTSAPSVARNLDIADISIKATSNWKLTISWDAPETVGAGVATYKVYRSTTSGSSCSSSMTPFSYIGSTAGTSYSDTSLTQQAYFYCVKACDSANNCSAVSSTVTKLPTGKYTTAAGLSSGPTVSSITTKKAKISWSTDRSSDSKIQYGTSSGSYFSEEQSNSTQTTDHSISLTNLTAGATYYYKAKWTDEDGNTGTSAEKSFSTVAAPSIANVLESDISISSTLITFTTKDTSKAIILFGKTTAYGGSLSTSTSSNESTYSVKLTGLEDGTTYHYKFQLEDADGNKYDYEDHQFDTLPRPRISTVRIQEVRGTAQPTVLITWETNTAISSIITYYPELKPEDARDEVNVAMVKGDHKMVIKGLFPQTNYTLIVKGRDKAGNEAESDKQKFTTATDTRPPQIIGLKIEGSSQPTSASNQEETSQLVVSWTTDEPSTSQVEYAEGSGDTYSQKTQEDSNLTVNHLVIISGLVPSKVYHLRAISKDKAGNEGKSIDSVTITPKSSDNAFNLVITNLSEAFGFLGGLKK